MEEPVAKSAVRLLLVERQTLVRSALAALLEREPSVELVAEVPALGPSSSWRFARPDVVLVSVGSSVDVERLDGAMASGGRPRLLLLARVGTPEILSSAIAVGASGVVFTDRAPEHLYKAIGKVNDGEAWYDRTALADLIARTTLTGMRKENEIVSPFDALTAHELRVVSAVAEGLGNPVIAERFSVSEASVRHALTGIFRKLGLRSRLELVRLVLLHGLPDQPATVHGGEY